MRYVYDILTNSGQCCGRYQHSLIQTSVASEENLPDFYDTQDPILAWWDLLQVIQLSPENYIKPLQKPQQQYDKKNWRKKNKIILSTLFRFFLDSSTFWRSVGSRIWPVNPSHALVKPWIVAMSGNCNFGEATCLLILRAFLNIAWASLKRLSWKYIRPSSKATLKAEREWIMKSKRLLKNFN